VTVIDFISRYISAISLAVVAILSLFNIGYFWKIGLQFLGLLDLSNLVYSFGLSLTALCIGGFITSFAMRFGTSSARQISIAVVGGALSVWGIWSFTPRTLEPQLLENGAILIGFILGASALGNRLRTQPESGDWRYLSTLGLIWLGVAFQAGCFQAALDLSTRFKYDVSTKSGVISNARILRASSPGLLLTVDGKIRFVPQGEVRDIQSAQ
jgi:hypothetical protein